ncbi:MAG: DUF2029 domain-containing protein [Firmicutes bacterium]|nr:DUF2029 domain-containing protein [Bacillota bacterium]
MWLSALVVGGLVIMGWRLWPPPALRTVAGLKLAYFLWSYRHFNYSDILALYWIHHLDWHRLPYWQNPIEYPVLIGLYMAVMAYLPGIEGYFLGSLAGLLAAAWLATWLLWKRSPRAAWGWALSPLLWVVGLINWDFLGIAAWAGGLYGFSRRRWFWAGLLTGLGASVKLFPVVFVPYALMWLWGRHRLGAWRYLGGALLGIVGPNLPFWVSGASGWSYFFTFNRTRVPDPGWYRWMYHHHWLTLSQVDWVSAGLTVAGGLWLATLVRRGELGPTRAALSALAWWFCCNKVWSPQYTLWILYGLWWEEGWGWTLAVVQLAGGLDFLAAFHWLALGTAHSSRTHLFASRVIPWVIGLREVTLLGVSLRLARTRAVTAYKRTVLGWARREHRPT